MKGTDSMKKLIILLFAVIFLTACSSEINLDGTWNYYDSDGFSGTITFDKKDEKISRKSGIFEEAFNYRIDGDVLITSQIDDTNEVKYDIEKTDNGYKLKHQAEDFVIEITEK